jgi:hypothetical protein
MRNKTVLRIITMTLLLLPLAPSPSWAQKQSGGIVGSVKSATGVDVGDATVDIIGTRRQVKVDAQGGFLFADVPPGTYLLQATSPRHGVGTAGTNGGGSVVPLALATVVALAAAFAWRWRRV